MTSRPSRAVLAVVGVLSALGLGATAVAYFLEGRTQGWVVNGGWMILSVAAVVALAGARRRAGPDARRGCTLLLVGAVCWSFGEALWVLWTFVPMPASPNLADFSWYAFPILTGVGLQQLSRGARQDRWVARTEIAPLAAAVCVLVVALVWDKLVDTPLSGAAKVAVLAYPAIYVSSALAVLQLVTTGALTVRNNPGLAAVVAGFLIEAIGFILWCPALLDGTYVAGTHVCDAFFSVGISCMAIGACLLDTVAAPAPQGHRRLAGVLPGGTLVALVAVQLELILSGSAMVPRLALACAVALVGASLLVRGRMLNREQLRLMERERRANEDALAARRELDGFFALSIALLGVADLNGRFRHLNPAWTDTLGWTVEEMLAAPFLDFVHPEDVDATLREMATLQEGAETLNFENRYRCKDGSYRRLDWKCRPDVEAGVIYATAHDVTSLRTMADDLVAARDQALEASRQKSEFLAMMSHEIRTPLNGVIGMTNLLAETDLDPEQAAYASTVGSSGEALLTIIDDILDFSKIEAGRLELDLIDFDVRETIEAVGEQFAARAHEKGLELALDIGSDLPERVHGDPARVRQVLTNLIGNAIKFTAAGEIVVSVHCEDAQPGEVQLRFEIRDTGVGITAEALPRIFESFTQADSSTTRRFGGSGLGLAICRRLTERMGGDIGATSTPGVGSTFWFTVHLTDVRDRAPAEPRLDLAGVRVLVVDDNATNREILEHQLRSWRMRPETAEDGASALRRMHAAARRGEPHELLLLDFNMPGMDGLDLARAISADPELSGIPMILLTSSGGEPGAGRDAGIGAFLTKPVRQSRLFDAIARMMGGDIEPDFVAAVSTDSEPEAEAGNLLRVLVAEDNEVNQAVATITLRKRGFDVEIAPDGAVAVEMAADRTYAAVFMDCQMPRLDGYDATRAIRLQEPEGIRVPIIAMTASAMRGDRERCLEAGMDDYLTKPLRLDDLDRVLDEWVRPPEPGRDGAARDAVDHSVLDRLRGDLGDDGIVADVVELFCADATQRLADLDLALVTGDAEALVRTAHTLKGSSANVGAVKVTRIAERLEARAEAFDLDEVRRLLAPLRSEVAKAAATLRADLVASE